VCNGLRELECTACRGYGNQVSFKSLKVKFSVIRDTHKHGGPQSNEDAHLTVEIGGRPLQSEDVASLPKEAKALTITLFQRRPDLPISPTRDSSSRDGQTFPSRRHEILAKFCTTSV
jgi:hypothetical protein